MAPLTATWTKVASSPDLQRSSHTLSAINSTLYIFGGELKPREPRDNELHKLHIAGNGPEALQSVQKTTGETPSPRVGAASTTIGSTVYIFSGRGGVAMAPIDEGGALWTLDTRTWAWERLEPRDGSVPEPRSYHCMTSDNVDTIFLHAGCPEQGRLSDLWAFSVSRREWRQLESAPDPPRGGASIAFVDDKLYRMNGFDGKTEQGGKLDVCNVSDLAFWESVEFPADGKNGPGARSVAALVPVKIDGNESLVTLFGESDPSSLGHQGAGKMLSDVWAYSLASKTWSQVQTTGGSPDARGWFNADVVTIDGKDSIAVGGGLGESNERLQDVWLLSF